MSMMTSSVEASKRGSFMSISSSVQQMGNSMAVAVAGLVVVNNLNGSLLNFDYCGYIAIVATILSIMVSYKVKQVA
jgi:sugar phosphate permease